MLRVDFKKYLAIEGPKVFPPDYRAIDLAFRTSDGEEVICELKPCSKLTARFAVRLAMGQLLDYKIQSGMSSAKLLTVLDAEPDKAVVKQALASGFGIAYKKSKTFELNWP
jgi:hypothetical protein